MPARRKRIPHRSRKLARDKDAHSRRYGVFIRKHLYSRWNTKGEAQADAIRTGGDVFEVDEYDKIIR